MILLPKILPVEAKFSCELSLDGTVRQINGVLPIVLAARDAGMRSCIVPSGNRSEASFVDGIDIYPVNTLLEAIDLLTGDEFIPSEPEASVMAKVLATEDNLLFEDIVGQEACKRAALIAASGFHHLLIIGPPGTGLPHSAASASYSCGFVVRMNSLFHLCHLFLSSFV